ncbi:MAG: hypothetical protein JWN39_2741, partial [Ilumatobacteraceae bacterium]|nr:hypothetical protein [Ilumatobacteraceae bacterium]
MDDITDDQWVRAMLDAEVPQEELRAGFEDALRGELRRAWRRSPALPEAERARRRRRFLLAACAAAVVLVVAAVVVLRPDHKSSIYSPPVTTDATTTESSTTPTTTAGTEAADSTTPDPSSSVPNDTVPPPSVPQSESSVLMKLDNGAPRLGATRVVAGLDLSADANVSAIIAPDGRIVVAREVEGKRVLATVSADGATLDDIGISLELDSEFLFGAHGDLYTFERPARGDERMKAYTPTATGGWTWVGTGSGGGRGDCHLEVHPDEARCGGSIGFSTGAPEPFDRVEAADVLGTADAAATITRTGGAVEHVWTTQLQMQRSLA